MKTRVLGAMALGLIVAACGTEPQGRVTGGAAAGAASGAAVGALAGPPGVVAGAAVGAAAGGVTGAATTPAELNLGPPPWDTPVRGQAASHRPDPRVRDLQSSLNQRGFNAGPADGVWGSQTASAVRAYQRANGMAVTGRPSSEMMGGLGMAGAQPMPSSPGVPMGAPRAPEQNPDQPAGN